MKTFGEIIFICGILIFNPIRFSATDELNENELTKIYKLGTAKGDTIDPKNGHYKIIKGEIIKEPAKKIWMKVEETSTKSKGLLKSKKGSETKTPYIPPEIKVFKDLKKGKKDLLGECVADMLNHGTYDGKNALIISGLDKNLKEHSSSYLWDKLSKIGPCMVKALRLLHGRNYVHRDLKPESFAFGTEQKVAPFTNQVYLFDVGHAKKYTDSNGKHRAPAKTSEFVGEMAFVNSAAMDGMTQSPRDDLESLFFVIAYLAGITKPFTKTKPQELRAEKILFLTDVKVRADLFKKYKTDVRVVNAITDFQDDLDDLFDEKDYTIEPEYDDFISCFDHGLSRAEIEKIYKFATLDKLKEGGSASVILHGNTTTDPKNKMEVVMKLMQTNTDKALEWQYSLSFKAEVRAYTDLKKGTNHSLLRENVCDMLDYGLYENRRAIIMPRLSTDWYNTLKSGTRYGYDELCRLARQAIKALRFIHKKGYLHQDLKPENFAFGSVEVNKSDKSQVDQPLKTRLYLIDFGLAQKYKYANNKHKPRINHNRLIGTKPYKSRTAVNKWSQSRRDEMESLMYVLGTVAVGGYLFKEEKQMPMWEERDDFISIPGHINRTFVSFKITDERVHKAFQNYADELKKLFVSDKPEFYEMEPDYNAFCVCFGGKPGDKACDVE